MKRLSIALAAIGLSASAFAALPAGTDPNAVTVPSLPGGFVIGASALYLQPTDSNGDLDYVATFNNTSTSTANVYNTGINNVKPGYNWGWSGNIGYVFPQTGNDVNLTYFYLSTDDTASTAAVNPAFVAGIGPFDGDVAAAAASAGANSIVGGKSSYTINQVDLTAGQFIDVGCRLTLHPNVGLRWASLDRSLETAAFYNVPGTNGGSAKSYDSEKSDFQGIGPIAGLDASYYVGMGFGFVSHVDTALLIGRINTNDSGLTQVNSTTATIFSSTNYFNAGNVNRVVTALDAKLGANYTYVFNNAANSDLTLEAGWQVSDYIDAVDRFNTGARQTSDLGLNGPYVNLTFHA